MVKPPDQPLLLDVARGRLDNADVMMLYMQAATRGHYKRFTAVFQRGAIDAHRGEHTHLLDLHSAISCLIICLSIARYQRKNGVSKGSAGVYKVYAFRPCPL